MSNETVYTSMVVSLLWFIVTLITIAMQPTPGDVNRDGEVNLTDLSVLAANLNIQ